MEKLHFQAKSTANLVKLGCTILFEKGNKVDDLGIVWHEYFNGDKGDQLFQCFMEEAFPNGCTIGERELMNDLARIGYMKMLPNIRQCMTR